MLRNSWHWLLACAVLAGCHPTTDVRGIYVNADSLGTFFPCTEANAVVLVPDTALATRYLAALKPSEAAYVELRGFATKSGSIYSGRRYFVVQQIVAVRPRAAGDCAQVAHPVSAVLPE